MEYWSSIQFLYLYVKVALNELMIISTLIECFDDNFNTVVKWNDKTFIGSIHEIAADNDILLKTIR